MNKYETVLFIWTALLTIGACIMYIDMHEDIKIYKRIIDNYKSYIDHVLGPQIKAIRQLVTDEIINKKEDKSANKRISKTNGCSMEKCPINAFTFKSCNLSKNECEYYTDSKWMYSIFNEDKIKEWHRQFTKEAEEAGMTLTEYLESINPLNERSDI